MITKITTKNADKYRALFAKATNALSIYDSEGHKAGDEGFTSPVLSGSSYVPVDITAATFVAGEVWYGVGEPIVDPTTHAVSYAEYRQTELSEHYDAEKDYFVEITNGQITSLEEYFQYIKDLCNISPIYTILPLDEEIFEIDANTRQITVPADFQKNGVSVQGDQISEILYFKIDRFYDMEDLHGCDIFIEWRTPADKNGVVYEGVSKPWAVDLESQPGYIIFGWPLSTEITSVPGTVTFSVRFYRFDDHVLKYSLSTLTNTVTIKPGIDLANSVRVNLETPNAITDNREFISNRLENSEVYDPTARDPQKPKFDKNEAGEPGSAADVVIASKADNSYKFYRHVSAANTVSGNYDDYVVYLTNPVTGKEEDGFYRIRSTVSDGGSISYAWIKMDEDGTVYNTSTFMKQDRGDGNNFILTTDTSFKVLDADNNEVDNHKRYYYRTEENYVVAYKEYTGERTGNPSAIVVEDSNLYELFYQTTLNCALEENDANTVSDDNGVLGSYQPRLTNRVGRKTDRAYGPVVRVEAPIKPVLGENPIKNSEDAVLDATHGGILGGSTGEDLTISFYVTANVDAHGYTTFEWKRGHVDTETNQLVFTDLAVNDDPDEARNGLSYVTVDHSKTVHAVYDNELRDAEHNTDELITADDSISAAAKAEHALIDTVVSYPMVISGTAYGESEGANGNGDGYYMCTVRTKLNSEEKVDAASDAADDDIQNIIIRVTHPAETVNITYLRDGTPYSETYSFNVERDEIPVQIESQGNEIRTADDYYEYQWYRYGGNSGSNAAEQNEQDAADARAGIYEVRPAVDEIIGYAYGRIDGQEGSPTSPSVTIRNTVGARDDGLYFCIITNHYNGSISKQSTRFINVTDYSDQ